MEWSKDKTLKFVELLQVNATLWNPSLCDTRRDKQKRKEELRNIAEILNVSISDVTKKVQHLRTQYNREAAKEVRANAEDPNDKYVSNWYAFEYLHFLKDSSKPYRVLQSEEQSNNSLLSHTSSSPNEYKLGRHSPLHKLTITGLHPVKSESLQHTSSPQSNRDEFSVFGEYIANELRSLKGEKNLLVAKKKIQDVIFEVKMGMICEPRNETNCSVYNTLGLQSGKVYTTPIMTTTSHIDPLSATHTPSPPGIGEIIINGTCHYPNFKVDSQ